jgi:hypothetical protein
MAMSALADNRFPARVADSPESAPSWMKYEATALFPVADSAAASAQSASTGPVLPRRFRPSASGTRRVRASGVKATGASATRPAMIIAVRQPCSWTTVATSRPGTSVPAPRAAPTSPAASERRRAGAFAVITRPAAGWTSPLPTPPATSTTSSPVKAVAWDATSIVADAARAATASTDGTGRRAASRFITGEPRAVAA